MVFGVDECYDDVGMVMYVLVLVFVRFEYDFLDLYMVVFEDDSLIDFF